uniref:Uncharacterized protein n=1 Tax=Anguilla anguilla TaxID=7936 RepID=A0A0E9P6H4_ANGAN
MGNQVHSFNLKKNIALHRERSNLLTFLASSKKSTVARLNQDPGT